MSSSSFNSDGSNGDRVTDAEVSKWSFLSRLKHYMKPNKISAHNRQCVEIAIMIETGTIIRDGTTIKKHEQADSYINKYIDIINEISGDEFADNTVRDSMILSYHGAKSNNDGMMLLRKHKIVMTEVKKFAYHFPGIGSLAELPSGSNQLIDMKRPYIHKLWKKKFPVENKYVWCKYSIYIIA